MPRVKRGTVRRAKRKKLEKLTKGYFQNKSKLYKFMKEAADKGREEELESAREYRAALDLVAKKRNEYGTRAQEGKDTAPRRRMFIGHEPAKGSRAAWRESKQEAANPSLTAPRPAQSRRCRHLLRFPRLLYCLLLPRIQSWAPMSAPPSSSAGSRSLKLPWAGSARTWVAFGR